MSHHQHDEQRQDRPAEQPAKDDRQPQPARGPGEPREYEDPVDEAADDSFPASDPPSWGGSTATVDPE